MTSRRRIRCAIYTRKSSDEGLEQDFNSLDAQHEACSAYVASQRHEGWHLLAKRYDDGGISGATLERPALKHLLEDIESRRIDMVVVYKIDRLTRSLFDFARIIETLDAANASFVSVTQSFNTATSMGRLTLNMLLSFAQFEREVTAERIRDKIAASKRKGLWMGGNVPLGYDPHPDPSRRELVVNEKEAETVRTLFSLYESLGCLRKVEVEAARLGLKPKARRNSSNNSAGHRAMSRGQIHYLLRNPVYIGHIRHKDKTWPGLHDPIIEENCWQGVQDLLQKASVRPRRRQVGQASKTKDAIRSSLTGKIRDETGDLLTPTHTQRHGRRLRYYVSNRLIGARPDPSGWRLPAAALETAVGDAIAEHLGTRQKRHEILASDDIRTGVQIAARVRKLVDWLREAPDNALPDLVEAVRLGQRTVLLSLFVRELSRHLEVGVGDLADGDLSFEAPFQMRRRGIEAKLLVGKLKSQPDPVLIRTLDRAHRWVDALRSGTPISVLAQKEGCSEAYHRQRAQPAFQSPSIQGLILEGKLPSNWSVKSLIRSGVPLDWNEQAKRFGLNAYREAAIQTGKSTP